MKMKIVIVNENNLSIEKGEGENQIKLNLFGKDTNMDGKPDGLSIVLTKAILDKAVNFILGVEDEAPEPPPPPPALP